MSGEHSEHCCTVSGEEGKDGPLHALRDVSQPYVCKQKNADPNLILIRNQNTMQHKLSERQAQRKRQYKY